MPRRNRPRSRTRQMALSGVFAGLAVVILLLGGVIPIATFTAPAFAGLCMLPVALEAGRRTAWLCYGVVSALSVILVPDKELVLFFIFILGYYPIVHALLTKICNRPLQYTAKLLLFNAAVIMVYVVLLVLVASPALIAEFRDGTLWFWGAMLLVGNITFVLYDILLSRLTILYICKWKGRFF